MDEMQVNGKQSKKIIFVIVAVIIAVIAVCAGYMTYSNAQKEKAYQEALSTANQAVQDEKDLSKVVSLYEQAIAIKPEQTEAYEALVNYYTDSQNYTDGYAWLTELEEDSEGTPATISPQISGWKQSIYDAAVALAKETQETGNTSEALKQYETALSMNDTDSEVYEAMVDIYISEKNYDDAVTWLDSAAAEVTDEEIKNLIPEWKDTVLLTRLFNLMKAKQYRRVEAIFDNYYGKLETVPSKMQTSGVYYFQDGKFQEGIEDGTGLIVGMRGIYYGNMKDSKRHGEGTQLVFRYNILLATKNGQVEEGTWTEGKANGSATMTYIDFNQENEYEMKITGEVKDDLFDGDLTFKIRNEGTVYTAYGKASKGDAVCIAVRNGKYVYAEEEKSGSSYYYWYFESEDDLEQAFTFATDLY